MRTLLPRGSDYRLSFLGSDVVAGITVAVIALPLALGFAITAGAPPAIGVTTAIVAGVVAAVFGGSNFQVTGPTGAMTVVLIPIISQRGLSALPLVAMLAGALLVVMAMSGIGRYVGLIPWPVITGFTNGIAVIILLQQAPLVLGIAGEHSESVIVTTVRTVRAFAADPSAPTPVIALITLLVMVGWTRLPKVRAIPASIVALVVGTAIASIGWFAEVPRVSGIPRGLTAPSLPMWSFGDAVDLARAALAVALLGALESLLSAVVADGQTIEERHDPNRELLGQGFANVAVGFFGGMPATGALARTAVNVRSGARTRLAAIVHGIALAVITLFLAPLASRIPLAVLGGILLVVAVRMAEVHATRTIFKATRSEAAVLAITMFVTIVFDLILAIEVGLIAAGGLFVARMGRLTSISTDTFVGSDAVQHDTPEEARLESELGKDEIVAYRIDGPIFFGAAARFFDQMLKVKPGIKVVVLRMRRVPVMDVTGLTALRNLVDTLEDRRVLVLVSGLQSQPHELLERTGILDRISRNRSHVFGTTDEAIAHARLHLARPDHHLPATSHDTG